MAFYEGTTPGLAIRVPFIEFEQLTLFAGKWTGSELRLHINGEIVKTNNLAFPFYPLRPGLFIGSTANGILPEDEGRFCNGDV